MHARAAPLVSWDRPTARPIEVNDDAKFIGDGHRPTDRQHGLDLQRLRAPRRRGFHQLRPGCPRARRARRGAGRRHLWPGRRVTALGWARCRAVRTHRARSTHARHLSRHAAARPRERGKSGRHRPWHPLATPQTLCWRASRAADGLEPGALHVRRLPGTPGLRLFCQRLLPRRRTAGLAGRERHLRQRLRCGFRAGRRPDVPVPPRAFRGVGERAAWTLAATFLRRPARAAVATFVAAAGAASRRRGAGLLCRSALGGGARGPHHPLSRLSRRAGGQKRAVRWPASVRRTRRARGRLRGAGRRRTRAARRLGHHRGPRRAARHRQARAPTR